MRQKLCAVVMSMALAAVALPFAPGLIGAADAVTTPPAGPQCPPPSLNLLLNPVVTSGNTGGLPIVTGGHYACVSLASGVMGGSPLPTCAAPGVLAVINAVQVGDTVIQGTVLCVSLASATAPATGQITGVFGLVQLLQALLGTLGVPKLPTIPTIPTIPTPTVPGG